MPSLLLVLMVGDPLVLELDSAVSSSMALERVISGLSQAPIAAAVATSAAVPAPLWIPGISETKCVVDVLYIKLILKLRSWLFHIVSYELWNQLLLLIILLLLLLSLL